MVNYLAIFFLNARKIPYFEYKSLSLKDAMAFSKINQILNKAG